VRGGSRASDQHAVGEAKDNPRPRSHPPHATLACDYLPQQSRIKKRLTESSSAKQAAGLGTGRGGRGVLELRGLDAVRDRVTE
jgi:hypothetical protein